MKQERIPELDGIRGCAILLVLIWHYVPCEIHTMQSRSVAGLVARSLSLTYSGVDLFFVLSGFLIAGVLFDNRRASNYFRVFYTRRVCRIFPLYFLLLGLYAGVVAIGLNHWVRLEWLFRDPLPIWSYASFTQNVLMGLRGDFGPNWLGITWSLAVEEQFYLIIPLIIWMLPRKTFAVVALLLVFLAPLLRAGWVGFHSFVWTPWRGDSLLVGALLAIAVRDHRVLELLRARTAFLYAAFAGFLCGAAIMTVRPTSFGEANHTWMAGLYGVFLLLVVVDRSSLMARILRNRTLQWLGITSYGIYMFHQTVSGLVHGLIGKSVPTVDTRAGCMLTVLSLVLTLVIAATSYRYFEQPFLEWGHRFRHQVAGAAKDRPISVTLSV